MSESVNEQKVFGSFARYVLTFCRNSATIRVAEGDILSVKNKYQLCDVIDCCKDQRSEQRKKNSLKVRIFDISNGSFRAERALIRHRLKWTRHFAHATGTVSVRVRRTGGVSKVLFEKVFRGNKSSPLRCSNREKAGVIRRRWIHSYGFCSKSRLGRAVRKRFAFSRTVVRSCFADLKISALLFDFCAENQYGWISIAAAQVRILAPHKAQASGGISVWLIFVRFRQSRNCFKTLKFQSYARTFQVRSGICFLIPCAAFPVGLLIPPCSY